MCRHPACTVKEVQTRNMLERNDIFGTQPPKHRTHIVDNLTSRARARKTSFLCWTPSIALQHPTRMEQDHKILKHTSLQVVLPANLQPKVFAGDGCCHGRRYSHRRGGLPGEAYFYINIYPIHYVGSLHLHVEKNVSYRDRWTERQGFLQIYTHEWIST